jgi:hypothetical protein
MNEEQLRATLIRCKSDFDRSPTKLWLDAVDGLFRRYPSNTNPVVVEGKIQILDRLYSTQLRFGNRKGATEHNSVAGRLSRWIVRREPVLRPLLSAGRVEAFDLLASGHRFRKSDGTMLNLWSFASKFAHFQNPSGFPIYDSRAYKSVGVMDKIKPFGHRMKELNGDSWYAAWRDDVGEVRQLMSASGYREVDKALWWWNGGSY